MSPLKLFETIRQQTRGERAKPSIQETCGGARLWWSCKENVGKHVGANDGVRVRVADRT